MPKWRRVKSNARRWQRNHLVNKYGNVCYLCTKPIKTMKQITIDHWEPLSKGGADVLDNYRLAHYDCNQLKRNMTPEEFIDFQKGNIVWNETNTQDYDQETETNDPVGEILPSVSDQEVGVAPKP